MRISDWSSDVCSSDLHPPVLCAPGGVVAAGGIFIGGDRRGFALARHQQFALTNADLLAEPIRDPVRARFGKRLIIGVVALAVGMPDHRTEERRVGKWCFSTGRFRWSPYH